MREYGQYTGAALVSKTHKDGTPWKNAIEANQSIISNESIMAYFKQHPINHLALDAESVSELPHDWYDSAEDEEWESYL